MSEAQKFKRLTSQLALVRAKAGGGNASLPSNHQEFPEVTVTVTAGNGNDVTDTTPSLAPSKTGIFLVTGAISATAGAACDNGCFAIVQHSVDGGASWAPITFPPMGDQRSPFSGLGSAGLAAAITTEASFAVIVSVPNSLGTGIGVKFKVVATASGGAITTTAGRGALTVVELG